MLRQDSVKRAWSGRIALLLLVAGILVPRRVWAEKPVILAIDVGGSGIKYKVQSADGTALPTRARRIPTPPRATPEVLEQTIRQIHKRVVGRLPRGTKLAGVVVGFPGTVKAGQVLSGPNLDAAAWSNGGRGWPLQARLRSMLGTTVHIANDLEVAAYGAPRRDGPTLSIGLGTGLGVVVGERSESGELVVTSPWDTHPEEMAKLENLSGNRVRHEIGNKAWRRNVVRTVLPKVRELTGVQSNVRVFGGNAKLLRRPKIRRKLSASGVELVASPKYENLRGAVPFWKARGGTAAGAKQRTQARGKVRAPRAAGR